MKKVGIVADNYKLDKFKKELTKIGLTDFEIVPFVNDTSNIKVNVADDQIELVKKVCFIVETHFKRSN